MPKRPKYKKDLIFKPALKCIYCGEKDRELTKEHIIPYSLDGAWIFPKASCKDCARITSRFESTVAKQMYITLRTTDNFQTREPKKRPKYFEVNLKKIDGSQQKIEIPTSKYPTMYPVLHLPPPGILSGAELSKMSPPGMELSIMANQDEMNAILEEYPDTEITFSSEVIYWSAFFRVLAKIAHALVVGHFGTVGYTPLLPSLILGNYPYLSHLVGGKIETTETLNPQTTMIDDGYELLIDKKEYIVVNIDIMGGRLPTYTVVAGKITDFTAFMTKVSHTSIEGKKEYAHGMRTRYLYSVEWALDIVSKVRYIVEKKFPELRDRWPLLNGFELDTYALPPAHYLLVLKNNPDTVITNTANAIALPHNDHPSLPPKLNDLEKWRQWCKNRLSLSSDQWAIILPVRDTGKSFNIKGDFELFSNEELIFYEAQWQWFVKTLLVDAINTPPKRVCDAPIDVQ